MALVQDRASQEDAEVIKQLDKALQEMPRNMLIFSTIMRSLYVDKAVGTNAQAAEKFRKLRDDTRNYAMIYLKHILPVCKEVVSSIQVFFEYYSNLNYEEWSENLHYIVDEVRGYKELCQTVVEMHESVITPLKQREDQAKLVMTELRELQQVYERKKREHEASASSKESWFYGLLFIPVVNFVACPLLKSYAESDTAKAVAYGAQANTQEAAACAVANELMPALNHFIVGLRCAAGFFQIMENELGQYVGRGEKAKSSPARLHHIMMNKKSQQIISDCRKFMFALPSVRTDFEAIPSEGTDQNYIDCWLVKQLEIIEKTCTTRNIYKIVVSGVTAAGHKVAKTLTYK